MSTELEREILAGLATNAQLLEIDDQLNDRLFSSEIRSKIFQAIVEQWEDTRSAILDEGRLREQVGESLELIYQEIKDGYRMTPEHLQMLALRLQKQRLMDDVVRKLEDEKNSHLKNGEWDEAEVQEILQGFADLMALELSPDGGPGSRDFISLSEIASEEVHWLWPNFFPLGKLSLISGDPGSGKTWLALDISSRISRGLAWPDGSGGGNPGSTIYLSVEDGAADTLRPRIDGLGGDASKIIILAKGQINLSEEDGVRKLEKQVQKIGDVRLVVVDPVIDFTAEMNPNAAEQVRALLTPLGLLAERHRLAIIIITHLNKAMALKHFYRASGSVSGWIGKTRACFLVFRDAERKKHRYFIPFKTNLSPQEPPQLAFEIINGRLVFERLEEDEIDVDEHLSPERRNDPKKLATAKKFLADRLALGPMPKVELFEAAEKMGISGRTLWRAKADLGITTELQGGKSIWKKD
jgi:hypothetical protein